MLHEEIVQHFKFVTSQQFHYFQFEIRPNGLYICKQEGQYTLQNNLLKEKIIQYFTFVTSLMFDHFRFVIRRNGPQISK
jgi:hypothetical protein